MRAVAGDVISTTDGRYGTVRLVEGANLTVEELPKFDLDAEGQPVDVEGDTDTFTINQAQVASIR